MCDRHKKDLDYYCLEHEDLICSQCATEEHAQPPCESMPLVEASKHVVAMLEVGVSQLKKLKGVSQSILDGTRQSDTLRTVNEAEAMLDIYVDDIKKKLNRVKASIRPFSELSREERWKLQAVAKKRIPNGAPVRSETADYHETRDLATRLQEIRKQTKAAKEALNALPNYVDVSVNQAFTDSLEFDGNPIVVTRKGQTVEINDELDDCASTSTAPQETVYLIEKSHFSLEHCTDIIMMDEYIIASVGDSVQKRDRKRMSFRQAMTLPGAGQLCVIGETSEVSVLQRYGCITILETVPSLKVLYRLLFDKQYYDISYLESTLGGVGCPEQTAVFAVCYTNREAFMADFVDLIQAKPTRYPGRSPSYNIKARTIAESAFGRNKSRFRGARSVSAYQGRNIVVGAQKGVTCISKTGVLIWTIDIYAQITYVMAYRTLVFVCVKDEQKILTIGKQGHVLEENILPSIDIYPQKLTAHSDVLMVKYSDKYKWTIFKKMYETVEN